MQGVLYTYDTGKRLVLFDSTPSAPAPTSTSPSTSSSKRAVSNSMVFLGGLGDGLHAVPYLPTLHASLPANWSLVQLITSSSYSGFGLGSLKRDADEIATALRYLRTELNKERIVLIGHSTGTQDVVQLFRQYREAPERVDAVVLQASISDREFAHTLASDKDIEDALRAARAAISAGQGDLPLLHPIVQKLHGAVPMSPYRFISLNAVKGGDDYFSSDLDDDYMASIFRPMANTPTLFVLGNADEYMPSHVDKRALLSKFTSTHPHASSFSTILASASHNISNSEAQQAFVRLVLSFLKEVQLVP